MTKYELFNLTDRPQEKERMARWFHEKWGVPYEAYIASMEECLSGKTVPQWYAVLCGGEIAGGIGVIENDFHERTDLTPNICAVYVEEQHRCRGIAGKMLERVCSDMAERGIKTLYLITDHDSFYERYSWEFFCMTKGDDGHLSRLYVHRMN